jgi:hypothetical protein
MSSILGNIQRGAGGPPPGDMTSGENMTPAFSVPSANAWSAAFQNPPQPYSLPSPASSAPDLGKSLGYTDPYDTGQPSLFSFLNDLAPTSQAASVASTSNFVPASIAPITSAQAATLPGPPVNLPTMPTAAPPQPPTEDFNQAAFEAASALQVPNVSGIPKVDGLVTAEMPQPVEDNAPASIANPSPIIPKPPPTVKVTTAAAAPSKVDQGKVMSFLSNLFKSGAMGKGFPMGFQPSGTAKNSGSFTGFGPGGLPMGGYTTPSGTNWSWPMSGMQTSASGNPFHTYVSPGGFFDSFYPGLLMPGGFNPSTIV